MDKLKKKKNVLWKNSRLFRGVRNTLVLILLVSVLSGSALTVRHKDAEAFSFCLPCVFCPLADPAIAVVLLELIQEGIGSPIIENAIERHMNQEQNFIVRDFFEDFWLKGLAELTNFLSTFGMYQVEMVGAFFDAKNYLETRRLFFELQVEAHKDYHPSEDFCWFGTNARSLAASESHAHLNILALSEHSLTRQLGHKNTAAAAGVDEDKNSRWQKFIDTYCDPNDNSWEIAGTGLDLACDRDGLGGSVATGALDRGRVNRDIDYTRLIDAPRTLNVDFAQTPAVASEDEEDVLAMASNLYGHNVPAGNLLSRQAITTPAAKKLYMDLRSVVAKRSVAENSFNAIVAMKSSRVSGGGPDVGMYMAAIIKDLMPAGTPDDEVYAILGNNPSYYAQLEVLGKKIYQNPDFFANLYDKPANVKRKAVAMKAIGLMLDRALFESELRQEMILSVMLSGELTRDKSTINRDLKKGKRQK